MSTTPVRHTSIVVVGGGPNGIATANLLGAYGIDTVVIEREKQILEYPRAVGMDDEALRLFQSVGLAESLLRDMIQNVPMRMFRADGKCFAHIRPATREYGWWRRNIFMQQLAEKTLREGLSRYPNVDLRLGEEVIAVSQDESAVTLQVRDAGGQTYSLQADYCVAADGGRSAMREMLGIKLAGKTPSIKWVVVDVKNADIDAPYTALNCDPRRPNVCIYLPYGFRRWEFLVHPHEDEKAIAEPESVRRLLAPYVTDPTKLEIVRARTYTHHSRVAEKFVVGRVALIGDAAHLSPPWIGQGLNAGLRDAGNVAWKLAGIVQGRLDPVALTTYDQERRAHCKAMIDLADTFGALLMPTSRLKAWARDSFFNAIRMWPGIRDYILQMRFKPMPAYDKGIVVPSERASSVGRMLIQPDVEDPSGARRKLDDVLGPWFALVGWQVDPRAVLSPQDLDFWTELGARFVQVRRSRCASDARSSGSSAGTLCVQDLDNGLADWFASNPGTLVVVRPDRYVAAQFEPFEAAEVTRQFSAFVPKAHQPRMAA